MHKILAHFDSNKYISSFTFAAYHAQVKDGMIEHELTDTDEEAEILSNMLNSFNNNLDPLLQIAFKIKDHGTRFTKPNCVGMWYGSEDIETSFSEIAYWRFREYVGEDYTTQILTYKVDIKTKRGIDFSSKQLLKTKDVISGHETTSYPTTHLVGDNLIINDIEAFIFYSARMQNKKNVAVISPKAFLQKKVPKNTFKWFTCLVKENKVIFSNNSNHKERYIIPAAS